MASTLTTSDFLLKFHSITGTTIGERRKNLFLLLGQASVNNLSIDFTQLQPRTPLEEKFKLETLIYFNDIEGLFLGLNSENPILVQRIIKKVSPKLVEALSSLTDEQLLNFLSKVSLNAKIKLLNKCGERLDNTQKGEEFFKAVDDKYGLYLATKLLTACSPEFIMHTLRSNRFKLTSRQFLIFAKKYPDYIVPVLEVLQKYVDVATNYSNVFKYLSQCNVSLFISLRKLYNLDRHRIGYRSTNNFIKHDKNHIVSNAKVYSEVLQSKYIRKSLRGDDFNSFYFGLFPPLLSQFDTALAQILSTAPNLDVLLQGFRRAYNTELFNKPKLVTPKILEMMTNSERLKILKPELKPTDFPDDNWVCYLNTPDAIALLKKRIFLTSDIKSRAKLISLLVETCRINKDTAALSEICNYIVKQHRNDHISVRTGFLKAIKKGFKLEDLETAHWSPMQELIKIFQLNGEEFYYIEDFMIGYIHFCFKNAQPINDALTTYLKRRLIHFSWNLFTEKPVYEKVCLQTFPAILSDIGTDQHRNTLSYINSILNWNKRHPNDTLPLDNPEFIKHLKEILSEPNDSFINHNQIQIMSYILKTKSFPERSILLKLYIPHMELYTVNWYLHSDFDFFIDNLESCVNTLLKSKTRTNSLWVYCKSYSHLELPQKIVEICLLTLSQEIPDEDGKVIKKNALTALSYLLPTSKLLTLNYNISHCLKHTQNSLEVVLEYCNTNRLPSAKRTIFSLMNNVSETTSLQITTQLMQSRHVAVRKVALYILFRTMEKKTIMNILKNFISDSSNAILNKFILSTVFKYFTKNPNEYVWSIIQLCIEQLDVDDQEAFSLVLQPDKVPEEYLTRYIVFTWIFVERLPNFYNEHGINLLRVVQLPQLPHEFCDRLIDKYFFRYYKNCASFYVELQAFVCKYICCNSTALNSCIAKVVEASHDTTNLKLRSYVNHFVKQMCYECVKQNKHDILIEFAAQWESSVELHQMFVEYLYIRLSLIKIQALTIPEIATSIAELCISLTNHYGIEILHLFSQEVKLFAEAHFIKGTNELYQFELIENIVKCNDSLVLTLLGIILLKNNVPSLIETKNTYDSLTATFQKRPELEVRMYLKDCLNM